MMRTLLEDVQLALRQMWRSSEMLATVLPLLVLGIALNVVALQVIGSVRVPSHGERSEQVSKVARTEVRVARTMVVSALKKIGGGQRRECSAKRCVSDRQAEMTRYRKEIGAIVSCVLANTSNC
jgi:hypothetical protein